MKDPVRAKPSCACVHTWLMGDAVHLMNSYVVCTYVLGATRHRGYVQLERSVACYSIGTGCSTQQNQRSMMLAVLAWA